MKNKTQWLPVFTLAAGILGLVLRLWLFKTGVDHKGLLITGHPAGILCFILTALVLVLLLLAIRPLSPVRNYRRLFPSSIVSSIGCGIAAAGILLSALGEFSSRQGLLSIISLALAVLAAACLVILAICRAKGTRPSFLLQTCLTVYLMLQLINQYRLWSPEPQLQVYFFPLLASVFLMLTAFHGAMLDSKAGSRRWYVFCNQAALFFCCMSLNSSFRIFYLAMGLFCLTNVCSLQVKIYRPKYFKETDQ